MIQYFIIINPEKSNPEKSKNLVCIYASYSPIELCFVRTRKLGLFFSSVRLLKNTVLLLLLFAVGNAKPTKIKEIRFVNIPHLVSCLQRQNSGVELMWHISVSIVLFPLSIQMHSMEKLRGIYD